MHAPRSSGSIVSSKHSHEIHFTHVGFFGGHIPATQLNV